MSFTDRLRELEQAATPGPWHRTVYTPEVGGHVDVTGWDHMAIAPRLSGGSPLADADLIVELRNATPEIIATFEERNRMTAVVEAVRTFRAEWDGDDPDPDMVLVLGLDVCNALDALEEKG